MAPELILAQAHCTTPAIVFYPPSFNPERTGVSTDDHGWGKYKQTSGEPLHSIDVSETVSSTAYGWWLGYYFTNGQPEDGQYEEVVRFVLFLDDGIDANNIAVRLYNVSGVYKFRLWNATDDAQIGSDSAAVTVRQGMFINVRADSVAETLTLFLDGSSIISASLTMDSIGGGMIGGVASTGTTRFWSAWCTYTSAADDLNEAHYPEMRLVHPDATGTYTDYTKNGGGAADPLEWDDLASEGSPDGDGTWNAGQDATEKETHNLTTHAMTNSIQALVVLHSLRQDQASKTVEHGPMIRVGGSDTILSYGTEDIGEGYVVREGVFHTEPSTGTWTQVLVDGAQAGHRRVAGSEALNIRVTALGVVVVALGTTNLAPPDPPASFPPISPLRAMQPLLVR